MTVSAIDASGFRTKKSSNSHSLIIGIQLESREVGGDHFLGTQLLLPLRQRGWYNGGRRADELQFPGVRSSTA